MKILKHICCALLLAGFVSCGASADKKKPETADVEQISEENETPSENSENINLITTVYNRLVFAIDSDGDIAPETYFTANALKKLQDDYEYDCYESPCYAYYALRTEAQDSNPESDEESQIINIEPDEEGWYVVSYSDMGWSGKTRVRIVDGKIDDYQRLSQQCSG